MVGLRWLHHLLKLILGLLGFVTWHLAVLSLSVSVKIIVRESLGTLCYSSV